MTQPTIDLHPTRDLVTHWRKGDAEKLCATLNETSSAFPGGGGWQANPEEIEWWIRRGGVIAAFVTEDGDRIVSLCNLTTRPGQKEHSYIPALACHPDYHGRKHGKSVLRAVVEYAYQAGFRKVDLNTWAGNMKAVPLYKKTGFMWRPETTVFMENFTPSARRHPLAAAYFARHDWYATLMRSVELTEDLVTRGKVRVYEYLWRAADGDFLRMVFDRQSWRLIEIETPRLQAAVSLPDEQLVAGLPHPVEWQIASKKPEPVRLFLSADGDPGVDIAHRETREVAGATRSTATFTIDPEIPEKTKEPTAALLTTELLVDDTRIELCAGIRVQQAVDVSLEPARSMILAGTAQQPLLTLRSHLDEQATIRLMVRPVHNARLPRRAYRVDLEPRGSAELAVDLQALEPGAVALDIDTSVMAGRRRIPVKTKRIDLLAGTRDGLAGGVGENTAFLCGGSLALYASRRYGQFDVHLRLRGARAHRLHLGAPQFGPPFSWDDLFQEKADAWVEQDAQGVCLHLRTGSVLHPGLILDRCIRLDRGPLIEVVDTLTNGSARALDLQRLQYCGLGSGSGGRARFCAPRPDGIVADFPVSGGRDLERLNLPQQGDQWPEGWLCEEGTDGVTAGVIWDRAERVEARRYCGLIQPLGHLAPGQTLTAPPLYGFVGDGAFPTVRSWWQLLFGPEIGEAEIAPPAASAPLELSLGSDSLLLIGDHAETRLSLRSAGTYRLGGRIAIDGGPDLRTDPRAVEVPELTVDHPVEQAAQVRRARKRFTGPASIGLRFETDEAVYRARARVLVLPAAPPPVAVTREGELIALANGLLTVLVAPGFSGAVVSLRYQDTEFLNSSYPQGGQRGWRNPWHGGIQPAYTRLRGRLHRERFRARLVDRTGTQGLVWRGVRLTCEIVQEDARGHCLFFEYLLAPGADVLAVVIGRRDRLGEWTEAEVGVDIWPAFADAPGKAVFHTPYDDQITGLAAPHRSTTHTWTWGGLVGDSGQALFLGGNGEGVQCGGWSEGPEGCVLFGEQVRPLPAGEIVQGLFFIAPARSLEEAQSRAAWSAFAALP